MEIGETHQIGHEDTLAAEGTWVKMRPTLDSPVWITVFNFSNSFFHFIGLNISTNKAFLTQQLLPPQHISKYLTQHL